MWDIYGRRALSVCIVNLSSRRINIIAGDCRSFLFRSVIMFPPEKVSNERQKKIVALLPVFNSLSLALNFTLTNGLRFGECDNFLMLNNASMSRINFRNELSCRIT